MSLVRLRWLLIPMLLLFAPWQVRADPRLEARRHFRNGMSLIERGEFERGIEELKAAYDIKPHQSVLFNIARAYQDSGQIAEAVEYYRLYLAGNPSDAATVRPMVDRLEASIAKPPPAPEAPAPTPTPEQSELNPELTAALDDQRVRRLDSLLERLEAAVDRAEARAEEPPPMTPASAPPPVTSFDEEDAGTVPYEELVVTASRRAQSAIEASSAMTVITREEIRMSGATSLVEVLRRVPGAEVMQLGVGSANVSLRGFNQRLANKVLVLIDGRTEYQDFLGLTIWSGLPIGLEEIERIEVIRGPGSALYGANAMLGVINIITRSPGTGPRAELNALGGSGNSASTSFVTSAREKNLRYRLSVAYQQADKWSRDFAEGRPDMVSRAEDPNLALRSTRANLTAVYGFTRAVQLAGSAGVNRFFTETYPLGLLRNYYLDATTAYAKADLNAGPVRLKLFWNHFGGLASPQYEAMGQRSLATRIASNVYDAEALVHHELEFGGLHRIDVGVSGRVKNVLWDYLAGSQREYHAAAFVQDEWSPIRQLRFVGSWRVDRHPLLDGGEPGYAQSPRLSAIFLPNPSHALRASASTAFRQPTFLESYTSIRVPVPGVNGASALTSGDRALRPEQLVAFELGYRGESARLGLEWDVALYQNQVRDLIGLSAIRPLPAGSSFDPQSGTFLLGRSTFQNEPGLYTARGAELGARYAPIDGLGLRAAVALQNISVSEVPDGTVCGPCTQAPVGKIFGGFSYRSRFGLDLGADASWTSSTTWIEREPAASDPTQIQALANPLSAYTVVSARVAWRLLEDRLTVALIGSQLGPVHQQHPFGNAIDRRFFANLTVTP